MANIKKLVMQGFKSFAKKTEIPFDPGINTIIGPNGSGKSLSYDSLVTLADGNEVMLGSLVEEQIKKSSEIKTLKDGVYVDGDNLEIISLNKDTMKSERKKISKFIKRKGETIYKIKTQSGRELKATGCHPVMSFVNDGVKSRLISDLNTGSLIACPRIINTIPSSDFNPEFARLIGYIIGDGYIAKDGIEFINQDEEVIQDYKNLVLRFMKCSLKERHEKNATRLYARDKDAVKMIRGLFNKQTKESITSDKKTIPLQILQSNKNTIANILAGLYDTDGSVRKDVAIIEFCTKNEKLARQVKGLLLRLGINSRIKQRMSKASNTMKKILRPYYYVYIYGLDNMKMFYDSIPLKINYKKEILKNHLTKNLIPNPNNDILPRETNYHIKEIVRLLGLKVKLLRKQYPLLAAYVEDRCLPTRQGITKLIPLFREKLSLIADSYDELSQNVHILVNIMDNLAMSSREVSQGIGLHGTIIRNVWATNMWNPRPENLEKFYFFIKGILAERIPHIQILMKLLINLSQSDIYWDKIVSIKKLPPEKYVYDLTVEGTHNFIANNIFAHNSNISDALCFVLGRLSIKSMRAAKAKNLLFMGSKYIKPAKEASVELVFNNHDKTFSIDTSEVSLKRIVRRNGQSIYKINDETRTRTEVIELLAHAGIDPHGFNLILQGQIQSIVKMHSEDRRKIIEEVAGISIYETRKEKSLKELEKTDMKLKEINAILRERTAYLRNLEEERKQALRYKELEKTVKRAKATILTKKKEEKEKELKSILEAIEKNIGQKTKQKQKADSLQQEIDKLNEQTQQINKHIQESTGLEQEQLHNDIANLRAELEGHRVRKESYENKKEETERRIQEMEKSIPSLEEEIKQLRKESPLMAKKSEELKIKKQQLAEIETERKQVLTLKTQLESIKERLNDKSHQQTKLKTEAEELVKYVEEQHITLTYHSLDQAKKELAQTQTIINEKQEAETKIQTNILKYEKLISVSEAEIKHSKEIIENVKQIDTCPLCQTNITQEHINHVIKNSEDKIEKATNTQEDSQKQITSLNESLQKTQQELSTLKKRSMQTEREIMQLATLNEKQVKLKQLVEEEEQISQLIKELKQKQSNLENKTTDFSKIEEQYSSKLLEIEEISSRTEVDVDTTLLYKERDLENIRNIIKQSKSNLNEITEQINELVDNLEEKQTQLDKKQEQEEELTKKFKKLFIERDTTQNQIQEKTIELSDMQNRTRQIEDQINYLKIGKAKLDAEIEALLMELQEFMGIELLQGSIQVIQERLQKSQLILSQIGSINMRALEVYDQIKKEYDIIYTKVETLEKEKLEILKIIEEIDKKKKHTFMKTFKALNSLFTENFRKLSAKGTAYLEIENHEDIFAGGITIVVKLAKGKYFDVTSLSGGEQTLVALSLLFAVQEYKPYHFYIFDEIDAALDKRNSERLAGLLTQHMKAGQYIIITHNDAVILNSNILYGISMHEGVSKVLSLKIEDAEEITKKKDES